MEAPKVLIVEDEVIIAETLQEMLKALGYPNSRRCKKEQEAEALIKSGEYGMAILDINLSGGHEGIELGRLCNTHEIPYFFLTSYSDRKTILEAKSAKPGNYVIKPFLLEEIMVAIELTLMHNYPDEKNGLQKAEKTFGLSKREVEILKMAYERFSYKEIGDVLHISLNTIKSHMKNIYSKLGVRSRQEAISQIKSL